MRIFWFLFFLPSFLFSQASIEVGYKIRVMNPFTLVSSETIIGFDSTATEGPDNLYDALELLGNNVLNVHTKIGDLNYDVNCFSELTQQRSIPLYTLSNEVPNTYIISIADTIGYKNTLCWLTDSVYPNEVFSFPYSVQGSITGQRFTFHTSAPVDINVTNGCELNGGGTVTIDNPNIDDNYEIYLGESLYLTSNDTVINNLPSGEYYHRWTNEFGSEDIYFTINNDLLDATLTVPQTNLSIQDATIIPELSITGSYDEIIWDFGDGSTFSYNDTNPVHTYSNVGQYLLRVMVTHNDCQVLKQKLINVDNYLGYQKKGLYQTTKTPYQYIYGIDGRLHRR